MASMGAGAMTAVSPRIYGAVVPVVAALGEVVAESRSRTELLARSIDVLAEALGWPQGEAWVPNEDGLLHLAPGTRSLTPAAGRFSRATAPLAFARGVGLPGLAWASGGVVVLDTLQSVPWYRRRAEAAGAGFDAAAAVAVATDTALEFVLAFHGAAVPDAAACDLVLTVAAAQLRGCWTRLGATTSAVMSPRPEA